ncbi:MAG: putative Cardiolipin synthetase (Cardiolipin synthase) synthase cls [Thermoleophilia bacterium]|nr:putative Cardiolipin synthetase (Cardiolipin synthase) synthase cls [Thermoleophilia bacterium]
MDRVQQRVGGELRLPDAGTVPELGWLSVQDGRQVQGFVNRDRRTLTIRTGTDGAFLPVTPDDISREVESLGGRWRPATSALADVATGRATVLSPEAMDAARPFQHQADAAMGELLVGGAALGQQHMPRAPRTVGNTAELLVRNEKYLPRLYADLEAAKHSITIAQFNWEPDGSGRRVLDLLKQKAKEGLDVRVMVDGWGFKERGFKVARAMQDELEAAGVKVERSWPFLPKHGWEHRKLIGIDDTIAYMGGLGFGKKYDTWVDMMTRLEGPAGAVAGTHALATWRDLNGPLDASAAARLRANHARLVGPTAEDAKAVGGAAVTILENRPGVDLAATEAFLRDIAGAKDHVWATSTYITTPTAVDALVAAAERGVDVRLLVTGPEAGNDVKTIHLGRTHYRRLLDAGVQIHERNDGILHAKSWQADHVTTMGSMNLSHSSMKRAREVMVRVEDEAYARSYRDFHTQTWAATRAVDEAALETRGLRNLTRVRRLLDLRF